MSVRFGGSEWRAARTLFAYVVFLRRGGAIRRATRVLASAGKHVRGSKSSEGVSTFRIVLQKSFDDVVPKEVECISSSLGEQGLAQSGRPRRANGRRGSSRGGKAMKSAPAFEGTRKSVAVVGHRSMKGPSGRRHCSFFTKEQDKRSWPSFPEAPARNRQRSKVG